MTQAQIVLLGNKAGAGGRYRIGHAVMKDALDIDGIYDAIRSAGLELPNGRAPRISRAGWSTASSSARRTAAARCAAAGRSCSTIRMCTITAIPRRAVGGVAAAAIGDPAVFVSVDAMHQGPQGGGPCIAIVDAGE